MKSKFILTFSLGYLGLQIFLPSNTVYGYDVDWMSMDETDHAAVQQATEVYDYFSEEHRGDTGIEPKMGTLTGSFIKIYSLDHESLINKTPINLDDASIYCEVVTTRGHIAVFGV